MGTYYEICSHFTARKGVTEEEIVARIKSDEEPTTPESKAKQIADRARETEPLRELSDLLEQELEIYEEKGRLIVKLEFSNSCAYETANELDSEWIELVKLFADFGKGAITCTSRGDDYEDGPLTWYIGPEKALIETQLHEIEEEIAELTQRRRHLMKQRPKASDEVVATEH